MAQQDRKLPIRDFRAHGYLHEVNRLVLHPAGLALEVSVTLDAARRVTFSEKSVRNLLALVDAALANGLVKESDRNDLHAQLDAAERLEPDDAFLSGVWDCRSSPEGIYYDDDLFSPEKAKSVFRDVMTRRAARIRKLGYVVQPIPGEKVLTTNYTDPERPDPQVQHVEGVGDVEFET